MARPTSWRPEACTRGGTERRESKGDIDDARVRRASGLTEAIHLPRGGHHGLTVLKIVAVRGRGEARRVVTIDRNRGRQREARRRPASRGRADGDLSRHPRRASRVAVLQREGARLALRRYRCRRSWGWTSNPQTRRRARAPPGPPRSRDLWSGRLLQPVRPGATDASLAPADHELERVGRLPGGGPRVDERVTKDGGRRADPRWQITRGRREACVEAGWRHDGDRVEPGGRAEKRARSRLGRELPHAERGGRGQSCVCRPRAAGRDVDVELFAFFESEEGPVVECLHAKGRATHPRRRPRICGRSPPHRRGDLLRRSPDAIAVDGRVVTGHAGRPQRTDVHRVPGTVAT